MMQDRYIVFLEETYKDLLDISKKYIGDSIVDDDMSNLKEDKVRCCDIQYMELFWI
ncbi:UNVERIFIED_CONTAM: hypothetical protein Cloal_2852 [Acetivibrio alkalicellulosi]